MLSTSKAAFAASALVLAVAAAGGSAAVIRSDTAGLVRAALADPTPGSRGLLVDPASAGTVQAGASGSVASSGYAAAAASGDASAVVSSLGIGGANETRTRPARTRMTEPGPGPRAGSGATTRQTASGGTPANRTPDGGTARGRSGSNSAAPSGTTGNETAAGGTGAGRVAEGGAASGPRPAGIRFAPPGSGETTRALAAARRAFTALPHSPRLLTMLAGPGGWPGLAGAATSGGTTSAPPGRSASAAAGPTASSPRSVTTAWPQGATATGVEPAVAAPPAGLDVAAFQHPVTSQYPKGTPINWAQVAAAHYRFAAIKGTEGNYYVNPWAVTDLAEAKAAGLDVSPYHFAIPNVSSGPQQAQYAVEHSGYAPGAQMLPLTLDIEYDPYVASDGTNECYGLSPTRMTTWIAGFVATAQALTGQYPIIYTTADWWHTCTGGSTAFTADPMWVAAYETSAPPLPAGWASWTYWQYTSVGTVPGVDSKGSTDLDTFSPTAVALIDPGTLASRPLAQVSIPIGSLGADTGETLTWAAAGLPPGIRLTPQGVLSGLIMNPPVNAIPGQLTYQPTVTAQNTSGGTSTVTFTWHVPVACPNHPFVGICPSN